MKRKNGLLCFWVAVHSIDCVVYGDLDVTVGVLEAQALADCVVCVDLEKVTVRRYAEWINIPLVGKRASTLPAVP